MTPVFVVADIFRIHGEAFRQAQAGRLGCVERRMMGAIKGGNAQALVNSSPEAYDMHYLSPFLRPAAFPPPSAAAYQAALFGASRVYKRFVAGEILGLWALSNASQS